MAASVRSSEQGYAAGGTATVNKPTGAASGDILVLFAAGKWNSGFNATCSGFTQIGSATDGSNGATMLYRIVDGSEGASFSVTNGQSEIIVALMLCIKDSDNNVSVVASNTGAESNGVFPDSDITPTKANSLLVFGVWEQIYSGTAITGAATANNNPGSWTREQSHTGNSGNAFGSSAVFTAIYTATTTTGDFSVTDPGSGHFAITLALNGIAGIPNRGYFKMQAVKRASHY